jgi:hypothetical protein
MSWPSHHGPPSIRTQSSRGRGGVWESSAGGGGAGGVRRALPCGLSRCEAPFAREGVAGGGRRVSGCRGRRLGAPSPGRIIKNLQFLSGSPTSEERRCGRMPARLSADRRFGPAGDEGDGGSVRYSQTDPPRPLKSEGFVGISAYHGSTKPPGHTRWRRCGRCRPAGEPPRQRRNRGSASPSPISPPAFRHAGAAAVRSRGRQRRERPVRSSARGATS